MADLQTETWERWSSLNHCLKNCITDDFPSLKNGYAQGHLSDAALGEFIWNFES